MGFLDRTIDADEHVVELERLVIKIDEFCSDISWYEMKVAQESEL